LKDSRRCIPAGSLTYNPLPRGLPRGLLDTGGSGLIRYAFSRDEQKPYLEFYSFHRIWGDLHARIYESGEIQHLAALETTLEVTGDPEKDRQRREEQNQRNRVWRTSKRRASYLAGRCRTPL
jgi:hypothetical protein